MMWGKVLQRVTWAQSHRAALEQCKSCLRLVLGEGAEAFIRPQLSIIKELWGGVSGEAQFSTLQWTVVT